MYSVGGIVKSDEKSDIGASRPWANIESVGKIHRDEKGSSKKILSLLSSATTVVRKFVRQASALSASRMMRYTLAVAELVGPTMTTRGFAIQMRPGWRRKHKGREGGKISVILEATHGPHRNGRKSRWNSLAILNADGCTTGFSLSRYPFPLFRRTSPRLTSQPLRPAFHPRVLQLTVMASAVHRRRDPAACP